jgi:hypothetical protein
VAPYASAAAAVDGRGDAALAWVNKGADADPVTRYRSSVYVRVWTASGRVVTRKLWSNYDARTDRLDIGLGAGEVTVAWVTDSREGTTPLLRAAYGPMIGRWRAPRVIGRDPWEEGYPPTGLDNWFEHLAVAPDGEVLLAFNRGAGWIDREPVGTTLVWRRPRRSFGAPRLLRRGPGGAVPHFDTGGTAYLSGYCNGFVLVAPAHKHRFNRRLVLKPGGVLDFNLSLSGAHRGFASWIDGQCSFDAEVAGTPGPVAGSALNAGTFTEPVQLSSSSTGANLDNVVMTTAGGTVNWATASWAASATFSRQIDAEGVPGAPPQTVSGPVALAADGGGDVLYGPQAACLSSCATGAFVRPVGGGADQPAPFEPAPSGLGSLAVVSPTGRAAAVVWQPNPLGGSPIDLSVWWPAGTHLQRSRTDHRPARVKRGVVAIRSGAVQRNE